VSGVSGCGYVWALVGAAAAGSSHFQVDRALNLPSLRSDFTVDSQPF
jgi:hypothetical protein